MLPDAINAFEEIKEFPLLQQVKLSFPRPQVTDIHSTVFQTIDALALPKANLKNKKVAITAGSRGISDIPTILASLVEYFHENGAFPFIVPSMGSHGGGTADGQVSMLAKLGITEDTINAPILSSLETVELGKLPNGMPVYIDKLAAESDAIVVVNRVKPHTDFIGDIESGLAKMVSIGLGKLDGADTLHRYGVHGLHDLMPQAAQFICELAPVLFGLAIVENAYHEVAKIQAIPPEEIAGQQEKDLLQLAYKLMPKFPFSEIDVLIVDEIGKNISGVGMDPKVIGRVKVHGVPNLASCSISTIVALDLTPQAHGNASGIGLADVTTKKLAQQIDFEATYLNCITSGITGIQRAFLPVVAPNDKAAIHTALRVCGRANLQEAKIVHIKNTLSLSEMDISARLLEETTPGISLELIGDRFALSYDSKNNLIPVHG